MSLLVATLPRQRHARPPGGASEMSLAWDTGARPPAGARRGPAAPASASLHGLGGAMRRVPTRPARQAAGTAAGRCRPARTPGPNAFDRAPFPRERVLACVLAWNLEAFGQRVRVSSNSYANGADQRKT